ncbi:MAG TPA: DNA primase [Streptosporangiaceae bacterium]|nr:DNA primase [Streptosporangiaceae bacterium]
MPGRIRDEDIALVRERSAVDEVIGEHLQLRNAGGGSLKGLCPFHDEKTPSFNVTPARGLWYCFSCTEGGDVIKFVQMIDNLGFAEAVERLAARIGVELRYEQGGHVPGQEHTLRRRLVEAHRAAADFYAEQLSTPAAAAGREFLSSRGFERADAAKFGVGYAPDEWDALVKHLRGRGFTEQDLMAGGLARQGRRGAIDMFRGRLVWPIADLAGDVLAFGARKLKTDDDGPKYLNTPETPLFKKSSVLYGADLARRAISQRRQAVIVEGYTDVMACHLAGIETAVATSGTSFGAGHIGILRRLLMDASQFRGEVIFTFDGDAAGQKAALRAFSLEEKFVTQTFVAVQPDGLDPCDLRLRNGDAAVRDLIAQRVPLFEFAIRSVLVEHDLNTAEGRLAALDAAAPIVGKIKDRGLRQLYAVSLDRWTGLMDERFVMDRVRQHAAPAASSGPPRRGRATEAREVPRPRAAAPAPSAYDRRDPVLQIEREALKLAVQRPALCGPVFDALGAACFTAPVHAAAFEIVVGCGGAGSAPGGREWAERLRNAAGDDQLRGFVTQLAVEPLQAPRADGEPDARYASEVLARIEELAVSRQIAQIKSRLQRMNPVTEQAEYHRMFGDLIALEQRHRVLIDPAADALQ